MSDSYLFECEKMKYQILVFGVSKQDARELIKIVNPVWYRDYGFKFVCKNPGSVNPYTLCATTEKQVILNRESLNKLLEEDN